MSQSDSCKCRTTAAKCHAYQGGYVCTQPRGHTGDHIACSERPCGLHRWPQTSQKPAKAPRPRIIRDI